MSLAAETRRAVGEHPFLVSGLRAGVINVTAAARFLDIDGEVDAIAAALRRYADDLPPYASMGYDARITMHRGIGPTDADDDPILVVGSTALGKSNGDSTALLVTGSVDAWALSAILDRFEIDNIEPSAVGLGGETIAIVVSGHDSANALRAIEGVLSEVPTPIAEG